MINKLPNQKYQHYDYYTEKEINKITVSVIIGVISSPIISIPLATLVLMRYSQIETPNNIYTIIATLAVTSIILMVMFAPAIITQCSIKNQHNKIRDEILQKGSIYDAKTTNHKEIYRRKRSSIYLEYIKIEINNDDAEYYYRLPKRKWNKLNTKLIIKMYDNKFIIVKRN